MRSKVGVVTTLFIVGAVCFLASYLPSLGDLFWPLWITGCAACIVGLILAVTLPSAGRRGTESERPTVSS